MSNSDHQHIDFDKLTAFIAGECDENEKHLIESWINASPENLKEYEACLQVYNFRFDTTEFEEIDAQNTGFSVDTDAAWAKVEARTTIEDNSSMDKVKPIKEVPSAFPWLKIAASLVIAMSLLFIFKDQLSDRALQFAFEDGINEVYLPDSSLVILKGKASLISKDGFNSSHRSVELNGTAYFDIQRDPKRPFIIETETGQIEVLGTAFLVDQNQKDMRVAVERGKVRFASKLSEGKDVVFLEKNEQGLLDFSEQSLTRTSITNLNELYWANKKLIYRQESLKTIFDQLSAVFNKEIIYDEIAIQNCTLSASFNDEEFEAIIENMAIALQFDYVIKGEIIEITSNGCN